MLTIELNNGSIIKTCESTSNVIRGKRSELISFWCPRCNYLYVDVPIFEYIPISSKIAICKRCLDNIIKEELT